MKINRLTICIAALLPAAAGCITATDQAAVVHVRGLAPCSDNYVAVVADQDPHILLPKRGLLSAVVAAAAGVHWGATFNDTVESRHLPENITDLVAFHLGSVTSAKGACWGFWDQGYIADGVIVQHDNGTMEAFP